MKSIQTLINSTQVGLPANERVSKQPSAMDMAIVDSVFAKLRVLFPVGAPKSEDEVVHKSEWLKTLAMQDVRSKEQVQMGLNRARREQGDRQFWPTPRQFALWCQPTAYDYGLPDLDSAYREAKRHYHNLAGHKWSHDVVGLAVRECGSWLFATGLDKDVLTMFTRQYQILCRKYGKGELVDVELPKALPTRATRRIEPAEGKALVAKFRRQLGLRSANDE
ncbi:replication protein P [Shewanella sp. Actino-trap-3]|uniref:replication protein P n=1 Tax=Shewanella sp. Actino-trap-3 TaxID=2058331 RepID=UPI000C31CF23|nr:replication protein P [Shewanella sp. Actino-trap-3]PKG79865.1 replication protein P [Shewanella sp. Actino-trap-3]